MSVLSRQFHRFQIQWNSTAVVMHKRFRSTDAKGTAEENVYFKKEDELVLKNLLSNHPEYNPKYSSASLEEEYGLLARDLQIVCKKYGVTNLSLAFIRDIQTVFEMHGYKKGETSSRSMRSIKISPGHP